MVNPPVILGGSIAAGVRGVTAGVREGVPGVAQGTCRERGPRGNLDNGGGTLPEVSPVSRSKGHWGRINARFSASSLSPAPQIAVATIKDQSKHQRQHRQAQNDQPEI